MGAAPNPDAVAPPPSGPPSRSEDDHVVLSIVIICIVMVPVGIFLAYLWFEKSRENLLKKGKKRPRSAKAAQSTSSKPYERVNTRDEYVPPLAKMPNAQFKFEL